MIATIETRELSGVFRSPINTFQEAKGSIHNDDVASKLGFKGGTVPGSIHMDQFVPLLMDIYGDAWFETGGLSIYFKQATVDREAVRAVIVAGNPKSRLTLFNEPGDLICEGTANVGGPDPESELSCRMEAQAEVEPACLRILADIRVGDEQHDMKVCVTREALDRHLEIITEPVTAYLEKGVLPPSHVIRLAHITRPIVMEKQKPSVGLFGALEVQHINGPLLADVEYLARSRILKFSESPKTENVWYDITFKHPTTGEDVGSMRYLLRFLKASSPLWD